MYDIDIEPYFIIEKTPPSSPVPPLSPSTPFRFRPSPAPSPQHAQSMQVDSPRISDLNKNKSSIVFIENSSCCAINCCPTCCAVARHNQRHIKIASMELREEVKSSFSSNRPVTAPTSRKQMMFNLTKRIVYPERRKESQIGAGLNGSLDQRARAIKNFLLGNKRLRALDRDEIVSLIDDLLAEIKK